MIAPRIRIGCPAWAHPPWAGRFFTAQARREDYLAQYASVFGAVEGNATFYGLPSADTVKRWAAEAPAEFEFCFKFPREVSHDRQLVGAEAATWLFFDRLAPLAGRLGSFLLQLPSDFGPARLDDLHRYLEALPRGFTYAVEVRHPDFFDAGPHERALTVLLTDMNMDRAIFDTRELFASKAGDEATLAAKRRKPQLPVRAAATGPRPMVRFVGDPEVARNESALEQWAQQLRHWLDDGRAPYFFVHHPDDLYAPDLGRILQVKLHELDATSPPPPVWPAERAQRQLDLFSS
jgi:uncharacterized protein YecE (DUF72 family)